MYILYTCTFDGGRENSPTAQPTRVYGRLIKGDAGKRRELCLLPTPLPSAATDLRKQQDESYSTIERRGSRFLVEPRISYYTHIVLL